MKTIGQKNKLVSSQTIYKHVGEAASYFFYSLGFSFLETQKETDCCLNPDAELYTQCRWSIPGNISIPLHADFSATPLLTAQDTPDSLGQAALPPQPFVTARATRPGGSPAAGAHLSWDTGYRDIEGYTGIQDRGI